MNLLILLASIASAQDYVLDMKRVFVQADGKVLVLTVAPQACQAQETKQACFERIALADCPKDQAGQCLPFKDMNKADLPPRDKRDKWRADPKDPSKAIIVDSSIILKSDILAEKEAALDAELAKQTPNPVAVIKAQRELELLRRAP